MGNRLRSLLTVVALACAPALLTACADDTSQAALTPPVNFTATAQMDGSVQTTWEPGTGADMYMVMRVDPATSATVAFKVPSTETSYVDTTAAAATTYTYMVHSMQGDTVSEPSNKVMVTTP